MKLTVCTSFNEPHLHEAILDIMRCPRHECGLLPVVDQATLAVYLLAGFKALNASLTPVGKARQRAGYVKLDPRTCLFLAGKLPEQYRVDRCGTDYRDRAHGRKRVGNGGWAYIHAPPEDWPLIERPPTWPVDRRWR